VPSEASSKQLLSFVQVVDAWRGDGADPAAARAWTRHQVAACRALLSSDVGWQRLQAAFQCGRGLDSWLATDWPSGFDELLLCAPLCQLVAFECARCTIGARQGSLSCAHPNTVFGRIGALLASGDRQGLINHLEQVEVMLDEEQDRIWDLATAVAVPRRADDTPQSHPAG
jgi:hypothetical protein